MCDNKTGNKIGREGNDNLVLAAPIIDIDHLDDFDELDKGDYFRFGRYPQGSNGEVLPITWTVLHRDKDSLLVISALGLDTKPYNLDERPVTWSECTLRGWLNDEFLLKAFTESERALIEVSSLDNGDDPPTEDRVFLLSADEAENYLESPVSDCIAHQYAFTDVNHCSLGTKMTQYAHRTGSGGSNALEMYEEDPDHLLEDSPIGDGNTWWWLRDCSRNCSMVIDPRGDTCLGTNTDLECVRPAFRIVLKDLDAEPIPISDLPVGYRFEFGHYLDDDCPITWRVLRRDEDSLLVISQSSDWTLSLTTKISVL